MPSIEHIKLEIQNYKRRPSLEELRERYILYYWMLYGFAPSRKTEPGEPVDLHEIGAVPEKSWTRDTPYSPACAKLREREGL